MKGKIITLTSKEATDFLMPRHYSGRKPSISYAYGWVIDDVLKANKKKVRQKGSIT